MKEENLMNSDPEYKTYIESHPIEWIDKFIRKDLIYGKSVFVESKMIWLFDQIRERLQEKFWDWANELNIPLGKLDRNDYQVHLEWQSPSAYYDQFGIFHEPKERGWYIRIKFVENRKDNKEENV